MRNYQELQLPLDFAQQLLRKEIKVKLNMQPLERNALQLLEMYSYGFQYYQSIGSYKHRYFQLKMKQVFESHDQYVLMQSQKEAKEVQNIVITQQLEEKHEEEKKIQRLDHIRQLQSKTNASINSKAIQQLLIDLEKKELDFNMRVRYELMFQQKWLEKKLEMRSRSRDGDSALKRGLKQIQTKTSLCSQHNKPKQLIDIGKEMIFQQMIAENEEDQHSELQNKKGKEKEVLQKVPQ